MIPVSATGEILTCFFGLIMQASYLPVFNITKMGGKALLNQKKNFNQKLLLLQKLLK